MLGSSSTSRFQPLALLLVVLGLLTAGPARADREGEVLALSLPVSGEMVLVMPPGNVFWQARAVKGEDFIEGTKGPLLGLRLLPTPNETCAGDGIGGARLNGKPRMVESPSFLPDSFYPTTVQSFSKANLAVVCADRDKGALVVMIVSEASFDDPTLVKRLEGLLGSLGRTFGAKRKAASKPATEQEVTLAVTGVAITLPKHWRATSETPFQETPYDELMRLDPTRPAIEMRVSLWPDGKCDAWYAGAKTRLTGTWKTNPSYRPRGFSSNVHYRQSGSKHQAIFCSSLETESLLVMAVHAAPLEGASFAEAKTVLERIAEESGADMGAPAVIVQPGPAPAPTSVTPAPSPKPTPSPSYDDDDDDWGDGEDIFRIPASSLDIRGAYGKPTGFAGVFATTINAAGGLLVTGDDDIDFGLEMDYRLGVGITTDGNIPFDFRFGLGPAIRLGPISISPVVGLGVDTAGAGGDFDMGAAFYWYPGGRVRIGFDGWGLSGYAARSFRGSLSADPASDVPNITFVESRLWFDADDVLPFLGFHWTDVERFGLRTQFIGGMVGFGIPLDD